MKWDAVQTEAKKKGWLTYAMDQAQTDVMRQPGPWGNAYSGFCAGCVVRWIALRYGGADYAFDSRTQVVEMPDWRATRDQNVYEDASGDFPDQLAPAFAQYGLTLNKGQVTKQKAVATGAMLRTAGSAATGCYYISLRSGSGGHAVSMQNEGGGKWRFFDANYGAFRRNSDKGFEEFIDWYMKATGYATKYTEATRIAGVNAPPYVSGAFDELLKKLKSVFAK
jgi:hypothetical protein